MNNKVFITFFLALLITLDTSSDDQIPTVKEFLMDESSKYDSYLYGLENGIDWAYEYYYRKHSINMYCKPNEIIVPADMLRKIIKTEIELKPKFFKKYEDEPLIGLALRNGMIRSFPCK